LRTIIPFDTGDTMGIRLVLTAALATVTLVGCSSTSTVAGTALGGDSTAPTTPAAPTTTTSSKPGKAELLAWVDQVCGVAVDAVGPLQQTPTLDQNNFTKLKTQFIDYLTKSAQALGKGQTDLAALKDGPNRDSGKYVDSMLETIGRLKSTMDTSIEKIKAANPKKQQEFALAVQGVGLDIQSAGLISSASIGVLVDKDLADAEKQAPKCQKLNA
jgi:ABC-type Fe3+-hydroxamate transport system substrate-binding protein